MTSNFKNSNFNFEKMREQILARLEMDLPKNLSYHDINHTLSVEKAALKLAEMESISPNQLLILRTAILYHDAGFIVQYADNEHFAKEMVKNDLPKFGYKIEDIEKILQIIHSTQSSQKPQGLLEELMADCDHDYFGRENYFKIADKLRVELTQYGQSFTELEWIDFQLSYIENQHKFFTKSAINIFLDVKKSHISELKKQRLNLL